MKIVTVTNWNEDPRRRRVTHFNKESLQYYYRNPDDDYTTLRVETQTFHILETPEQITELLYGRIPRQVVSTDVV